MSVYTDILDDLLQRAIRGANGPCTICGGLGVVPDYESGPIRIDTEQLEPPPHPGTIVVTYAQLRCEPCEGKGQTVASWHDPAVLQVVFGGIMQALVQTRACEDYAGLQEVIDWVEKFQRAVLKTANADDVRAAAQILGFAEGEPEPTGPEETSSSSALSTEDLAELGIDVDELPDAPT